MSNHLFPQGQGIRYPDRVRPPEGEMMRGEYAKRRRRKKGPIRRSNSLYEEVESIIRRSNPLHKEAESLTRRLNPLQGGQIHYIRWSNPI